MALLACRLWLREGGREGGRPLLLLHFLLLSPGDLAMRRSEKGKRKDSPSVKDSFFVLSHRCAMRLAKVTPMPLCLHPSPFLSTECAPS